MIMKEAHIRDNLQNKEEIKGYIVSLAKSEKTIAEMNKQELQKLEEKAVSVLVSKDEKTLFANAYFLYFQDEIKEHEGENLIEQFKLGEYRYYTRLVDEVIFEIKEGRNGEDISQERR